mmetsp:Transcript_37443/g.94076  ORF Transcript_37443/g.94076 Transcript_37443/m.94076 type:complete len:236 (-) Transcript_37443:2132-2839(-)
MCAASAAAASARASRAAARASASCSLRLASSSASCAARSLARFLARLRFLVRAGTKRCCCWASCRCCCAMKAARAARKRARLEVCCSCSARRFVDTFRLVSETVASSSLMLLMRSLQALTAVRSSAGTGFSASFSSAIWPPTRDSSSWARSSLYSAVRRIATRRRFTTCTARRASSWSPVLCALGPRRVSRRYSPHRVYTEVPSNLETRSLPAVARWFLPPMATPQSGQRDTSIG